MAVVRLSPVRRLGALALSLSLAVAIAACTGTQTGHGKARADNVMLRPTAPGSPASFGPCSSRAKAGADRVPAPRRAHLRYTCAALAVPLDYRKPQGRKITIKLIKAHYVGSSNPKPLLLNRGGPGVAGIDFAISQAASVPLPVLQHYDLIGFDPRGVGSSTPIRCFDTKQKDAFNAASPDMRTQAGFAEAKSLAATFAHACSAKYGSALADFNTVQTAKDMDLIRRALGETRLDYLGFSYGTELGAQYAHLYPSRVGAFVLDGAVDPLTPPLTSFANQLQGFESAFDQFAAWCRDQEGCSKLGDPRQAVYDILDAARRSPLHVRLGGNRNLTASLADLGVLSALYSQSLWSPLAQALLAAEHGDGTILLELADLYNERTHGHYTNVADANVTISCNDERPGPSDAVIRTTTRNWVERFPMFGLYNAPSLFQCQAWQPHRTVLPLPTANHSATKILVLGNVHDPATPYQGTKDLAKVLGNARILTWDGEGHTSFEQGSSCVDGLVANYFDTLQIPTAGRSCPR